MARKTKVGLDYFPHDIREDDELQYLEVEFGLEGWALYFKLLRLIYAGEGYYMQFDDRKCKLVAKDIGVDAELLSKVVEFCLKEGLFDGTIHRGQGVLTSKGIQTRYIEATVRRQSVILLPEYLCESIKDNINQSHANNQLQHIQLNGINVDINSQSKVKESKVEESKLSIESGDEKIENSKGGGKPSDIALARQHQKKRLSHAIENWGNEFFWPSKIEQLNLSFDAWSAEKEKFCAARAFDQFNDSRHVVNSFLKWLEKLTRSGDVSNSGSRYKDYYDPQYEKKLEGSQLSAYWQHLRALGWLPKKDATGRIIDWTRTEAILNVN